MFSRTKKQLSKHELNQLVSAGFNGTSIQQVTELTEGWYNVAYSITLDNDMSQQVILKVAPPSDVPILTYEQGIMQTEVQVFKILQEHTQVPVPDILFADFSHDVIHRDYYFMSKFQGTPLNHCKDRLSKEQIALIWAKLGKYCAQINSIEGSYFGYINKAAGLFADTWTDAFYKMVSALLSDAERFVVKLPIASEDITNIIENQMEHLERIKKPRLVHWDLWEGNIFIHKQDETYTIEGIVDTERALYGDPVIDVPFNAVIQGSLAGQIHPFLTSYNQEADETLTVSEDMKIRKHLYNIYLCLIILIESKSRQYSGEEADRILPWAKDTLIESFHQLK